MTQSRVDDVINALVAAFDAAVALDGVTVVKGWRPPTVDDPDTLYVASEGEAAVAADDVVASSEIEWAGLGALARTESGEITCAARSWTGNQDDMAGRIVRAYAMLGACEDIIKADLTLGGPVTFQSAVARTRLRTVQDTAGCAAIAAFDITFQTRI